MEQMPFPEYLKQIAHGIAQQFGSNCEVVVHSILDDDLEHPIIAIENGHVSGREIGDGPSHAVLEALRNEQIQDNHAYLTRTKDGKIIKSTSLYLRDASGIVRYILAINLDITGMLLLEHSIKPLISTTENTVSKSPDRIVKNVNELLDELIEQSVEEVGKPVPLMSKDDKIRAIRFLNHAGAFLITKSGDKISKYFGISKYTLYSYIDAD